MGMALNGLRGQGEGMEIRILVLNSGSSSLKYEVIEMPRRRSIGKGLVERIGDSEGRLVQSGPKGEICIEQEFKDHASAMEVLGKALIDPKHGLIASLDEIQGIGHRVVHGGEKFASSVIIDADVIAAIEEAKELAPLHNGPNLVGISVSQKMFPGLKQVAVFDTAFHQTMPPSSYLYGLPREFYDKHKIRRYGFHGTSHRFVASRSMELMRRFPENTNLITCHLGNGASLTAIENGKSIDTSMGFTPLEGVMMGTRCGDIDPAILPYLEERGYTPKQLNSVMNKQSGLLGLSGISNDMRDLEGAAAEGNVHAQEALDVYAHKVRKYIGAYSAELVKVDALVFTGGIGQHGAKMRERICRRLEHIGIVMDYELNAKNGSAEGVISARYSPVTILVVPTNEELQIAMDVFELLFPGKDLPRRRHSDVHLK